MPNGQRGIVHELGFDKEFEALEPDPLIREEIISGIDFILGRFPQRGAFSEGRNVWIRELCDPFRKRRFWLFYTFNDHAVILISIEQIQAFEIWPE